MNPSKIEREQRMVEFMIRLYCRKKHKTVEQPCSECTELITYARQRLLRCPFGENKGPCRRCPRHCYSPVMKLRITQVMRYVAPRMFFISPIEALKHIL